MMRRTFIIAFVLFALPLLSMGTARADWDGLWQTTDAHGSEFYIEVKPDGLAHMYYGDGIEGTWKKEGSGLRIVWEGGKEDFLFNGVMGRQRLSSDSQTRGKDIPGYSSAMTKIEALPDGI